MSRWDYRKYRFWIMIRNLVFYLLSLLGIIPALIAWAPAYFVTWAKATVAFEKRIFSALAKMVLDEEQQRYFAALSWAKERFEEAAQLALLALPEGKRDTALAFAYFASQWKMFIAQLVLLMIVISGVVWWGYRRDVRRAERTAAMLAAQGKRAEEAFVPSAPVQPEKAAQETSAPVSTGTDKEVERIVRATDAIRQSTGKLPRAPQLKTRQDDS